MYWCSATSGSHSKGFSSLPPCTHILVHVRKQTHIECTAAHKLECTFTNTYVLPHSRFVTSHSPALMLVARKASNCGKLMSCIFLSHSQRDLPGPERWSPCLRLIPSFATNYFMPLFELSVEIQLSGSLCSLQDWGGDEGRRELGRLRGR